MPLRASASTGGGAEFALEHLQRWRRGRSDPSRPARPHRRIKISARFHLCRESSIGPVLGDSSHGEGRHRPRWGTSSQSAKRDREHAVIVLHRRRSCADRLPQGSARRSPLPLFRWLGHRTRLYPRLSRHYPIDAGAGGHAAVLHRDVRQSASSSHQWGWQAQRPWKARRDVAALIGAAAGDHVHERATGSNNFAIRGLADLASPHATISSCPPSTKSVPRPHRLRPMAGGAPAYRSTAMGRSIWTPYANRDE
jgi:hypothetical protein